MIKKIIFLTLGFLILLTIQFTSNLAVKQFHIPFPAPLLGMIILAVLLHFNVIPKKFVEDICNLLLKNMALFFVPLLVGIIAYGPMIKANLVPIASIIIFATFLTMLLTAYFVDFVIKIAYRGKQK